MYYRSYTTIDIWHALSLDISIPYNIFLYEQIKWNIVLFACTCTLCVGLDISKPSMCIIGLGS